MIGYEAGPISLPFMPNNNSTTTLVPYTGYAILGGSANDVIGVFYVPFKCQVRRALLSVAEAVVSDTQDAVVYFDKADIGTVPTEDGDLAIITVPHGQAAGTSVYDDAPKSSRITLNEGDWVVVSLQTDATSAGTVAGFIFPQLLVTYVPEVAGNVADLTETA